MIFNVKVNQFQPTIEQTRIRGQYEQGVTDTAMLAQELSEPQNVEAILVDFDQGFTHVRDVGRMLSGQREAILEAYQDGTELQLFRSHPDVMTMPIQNLNSRVTIGPQDQTIGHNFFVNATGFIKANFPWAQRLDKYFTERLGKSIYEIAHTPEQYDEKDDLLAAITESNGEELTIILATYLAGRSLVGERKLLNEYGDVLNASKHEVATVIEGFAQETGLRADMLERAQGQLERATFGSNDHLDGLITSHDTGVAGDYAPGTLRVEVQYEGSISQGAQSRSHEDATHIISHELHHATSAQAGLRCGLVVGHAGLDVNEGMTEFLAQHSLARPMLVSNARGEISVPQEVPYRIPVLVTLALYRQFVTGTNNHFATLFNAYHGDVGSQTQLEDALDHFYQLEAAVRQ